MLYNLLIAASSLALLAPAGLRALQGRRDEADLAVRLGFMVAAEWPGQCLCPFGPYIGSLRYSAELGITEAQEQQLDRLTYQAPPEQRRELAFAVLTGTQYARLFAFVQVVREAARLGLIPRVAKGDCLCG